MASESSWNGSYQATSVSNTVTFNTKGQFLDRNIVLSINIPGVTLKKGETFYIQGEIGPRFVWTCDATTGAITITGEDKT